MTDDVQSSPPPAAAPNEDGARSSSTTNFKGGVIVIGAGAAGLTAAYDLKRKKIPVTVLEAHEDSFGGRIKKLERGSLADFPIDLGAEWVHKPPKILKRIIHDDSVAATFSTKERTAVYQFAPYSEWTGRGWALKWSTVDETEYLWKFVDSTWHDFFHDFIVPSIEYDIKFGSVVNRIEYNNNNKSGDGGNGGVIVTCQDGRVFYGDQVIVTVSLSILQQERIEFVPPLPPAKKRAIQQVPFEPGFKAFLEFSERFYFQCFGIQKKHKRLHGEMHFYDQTALHHSKQQQNHQTRNVLSVFCYGEQAEYYVNKTDDEIIQTLLQELDEAFVGRATETYLKGVVQNWSQEEHVGGAYSSYRNGMKPMYTILQPLSNDNDDKCVFFAGEHLPPDGAGYGLVTGAAFSGRSAAKSVACVREGKKPPFPWRIWIVSSFWGKLCCGLEHWLFFHDLHS